MQNSSKRLRILVVTHFFPPLNSIASHRPFSWAKAWSEMGHEIHVLTTEKYAFDGSLDLKYDLSGFQVHVVPYLRRKKQAPSNSLDRRSAERWEWLKKKSRRLRFGLGMFGDLRMLAYFRLARAGKILLERQRFDFIVSTYQPEVVHFAAHKLSRDFGVPWVADYRDLWFKDISGLAFGITSYLVGKIEKHLLKQACLVSTVSEGLSRQLQEHFGREVHVCYNGYVRINEHDRHTSHPGIKRIVYTGRVYRKLRDPSLLFGVLGQIKKNVPNLGRLLTVDFYGHMEQWVDDLIKKHDIEDCVRLHGAVSYQESLSAQDGADFLLFLDWMDRATEGVLTGKLFEYLGTGRPILSIGPGLDTEAAKIIEQCMAGLVMSEENDILQFLESWLIRGEMTAPVPDKTEIARYSRENQARALLEQIQRKLPS